MTFEWKPLWKWQAEGKSDPFTGCKAICACLLLPPPPSHSLASSTLISLLPRKVHCLSQEELKKRMEKWDGEEKSANKGCYHHRQLVSNPIGTLWETEQRTRVSQPVVREMGCLYTNFHQSLVEGYSGKCYFPGISKTQRPAGSFGKSPQPKTCRYWQLEVCLHTPQMASSGDYGWDLQCLFYLAEEQYQTQVFLWLIFLRLILTDQWG